MDNPFNQSKSTNKLYFNILYKYLATFEDFFSEKNLAISTFEVESKTIEAQDDDLWHFEVYLDGNIEKKELIKNLQNFASINDLEIIGKINFEKIEEKDWVLEYQKQISPICIGKFFIAPIRHLNKCPDNFFPIILESSRAFGTGEHETTAGCLEMIAELSPFRFKTIFDIGTGSGILSFAAANLWPEAEIWACDTDEVAVETAKTNQKLNIAQVNFFQNSPNAKLKIPKSKNKKFDLIISNILAKPLIDLAPSIISLLNNPGRIILSGFLNNQTEELIRNYEKYGAKIQYTLDKNDWIVILAKCI